MGKQIDIPGVGIINMVNAEDFEDEVTDDEEYLEEEELEEEEEYHNITVPLEQFQDMVILNKKMSTALEISHNLIVSLLVMANVPISIPKELVEEVVKKQDKTFTVDFSEDGLFTIVLKDVAKNEETQG
jgi:hypothetical protein